MLKGSGPDKPNKPHPPLNFPKPVYNKMGPPKGPEDNNGKKPEKKENKPEKKDQKTAPVPTPAPSSGNSSTRPKPGQIILPPPFSVKNSTIPKTTTTPSVPTDDTTKPNVSTNTNYTTNYTQPINATQDKIDKWYAMKRRWTNYKGPYTNFYAKQLKETPYEPEN